MPGGATIVVSLTAEQADFISKMAAADASTKRFGESALRAKEGAHKMGEGTREFTHELRAFGSVTGAASGELMHMFHAFELAPGPIGVAIAALLALKGILDANTESAKRMHENISKDYKLEHQTSNFLNGTKDSENQVKLDALKERRSALLHEVNTDRTSFFNQASWGFGDNAKTKSDLKTISELDMYIEATKNKMEREGDTGSKPESSSGAHFEKAVSTGDLGQLHVERTQEVAYLAQIAANTAAAAAAASVGAGGDHKDSVFQGTSNLNFLNPLTKNNALGNIPGAAGGYKSTTAGPSQGASKSYSGPSYDMNKSSTFSLPKKK